MPLASCGGEAGQGPSELVVSEKGKPPAPHPQAGSLSAAPRLQRPGLSESLWRKFWKRQV